MRTFIIAILSANLGFADCITIQESCLEPGVEREVHGIFVSRDCWKYKYTKECDDIPSQNDCDTIDPNYCDLAIEECATYRNEGGRDYCINFKKTYVCQQEVQYEERHTELIIDKDDEIGRKSLLCKELCLDGSCLKPHKTEANDELASSIAQLQMLTEVKKGLSNQENLSFDIFKGEVKNCSSKVTDYSKCCNNSGWAKNIGLVSCKPEEIQLAEDNKKGKCIYLGKICVDKKLGACMVQKKRYCCYPNILSKAIQIGARAQLGIDFGNAESPNCGGLSIEQLSAVDFSQVDFSEFFNREIASRIKDYSISDQQDLMRNAFPSLQKKQGIDREKLQ